MSLTKTLLKEFGDLSNTYNYRKDTDEEDKISYEFKTNEGLEVFIYFFPKDGGRYLVGWSIDYSTKPDDGVDAQKVLNTLFQIIKEFYEENKDSINLFIFHSDKKRTTIYKNYINKIFPSARVQEDGYDPNAFIVKV